MNILWNLLLHAVIISTIVGLLITVAASASKINYESETIVRYVALFTGLLIYLGLKTSGISLPEILQQVVPEGKNQTESKQFLAFWALGAGAAFAMVYSLATKFGPNAIARLSILFASFFIACYSDFYFSSLSFKNSSGDLNTHLLPNLAFTVGMALYFILFVKSKPEIQSKDIIPEQIHR